MSRLIILIFLVTVFLTQSCDNYFSVVPVTDSKHSKIDTSLIGRWVDAEIDTPDHDDYLDIIAFNEKEYLLKVPLSFNKKIESVYVFKAYNSETEIGNIINVINIDLEQNKVYTFYKCKKLSNGNLKIYYLANDHMNEKFDQSEELLGYINEHPDSVTLSLRELTVVKPVHIKKKNIISDE